MQFFELSNYLQIPCKRKFRCGHPPVARAEPERTSDDSASGDTPTASSLPLTQPRLTYVFLAANLSVYAAGIAIALIVGNEASNDFFLELAMMGDKVRLSLEVPFPQRRGLPPVSSRPKAPSLSGVQVAQGEFWRLLSANFMHAGLLHLALNCTALFYLAPEAEAVLGCALQFQLMHSLRMTGAPFMRS